MYYEVCTMYYVPCTMCYVLCTTTTTTTTTTRSGHNNNNNNNDKLTDPQLAQELRAEVDAVVAHRAVPREEPKGD